MHIYLLEQNHAINSCFFKFFYTTQFAPLIKSDISEAKDGSEYRYGLRYEQLLAPIVKAIQELAVKVAALESA